MNFKLRLLASAALAVVTASLAHGQAYAYGSDYATVQFTGAISYYGGYSVGGVNFVQYGGYVRSFGPYGATGNVNWSDYTSYQPYSATASGYALASPNGQIWNGVGVASNELIAVYNTNPFPVEVLFTGYTGSYSFASLQANGDEAWSYGTGGIYLGFFSQYLLQRSASDAAVLDMDGLAGVSSVTSQNYFLGYSYTANYYYGNITPFSLEASSSQIYDWGLILPSYSEGFFKLEAFEFKGVESERTNSVPTPAAIGPFAVGLLAALRRRRES
jgi:MYXO-CTERM domain-containing protein